MMSSFKFAFHAQSGRRMIEIWNGEEFIGAIYPAERGVHIVSKHSLDVTEPKSSIPGNSLMITIGRSDA